MKKFIILFLFLNFISLLSQTREDRFISDLRNKVMNEIEQGNISRNINDKINEIVKYHKFKNTKEGFNFIESLLKKTVISENDTLRMQLFSLLAGLYLYIGQTEYASKYLFRAYNISSKLKRNLSNGWTLIGIGNLYYSIKHFDKSYEYYSKALNNFRDILASNSKNDWENANFGVAVSLENIAMSCLKLSKYDTAICYAKDAIPYRMLSGNNMFIQYSKMNLAKIFLGSGQIDSSIKYFHESIELSNKNVRGIDKSQQFSFAMQSYNGLFKAYTQKGIQDSADYYFKKINLLLSKLENVQQFVENYTSNAYYFFYQKNYGNSIIFAKKSMELTQRDSLDYLLHDIYQVLYYSYRDLKKNDSAYKYLELTFQNIENERTKYNIQSVEFGESNGKIEKSLYENEENVKKIDKMSYQRNLLIAMIVLLVLIGIVIYNRFYYKNKMVQEIAKKNEELLDAIDKLNAYQIELNATNEELKNSNNTKNTLFSIIAHDLKNSIGSVRDAINLLNKEYNILSDEEKIEFIELSKSSSDNLYLLLENLLLWSSAQRQSIKINIIETNLKIIASQSIQLYYSKAKDKNISFINDISEDLILKVDPNQIDTVIRNILNNAVKFTKKNGEIKIYNYQQDKNNIVVVEDNGIGMPKDKADNLFKGTTNKSTYGTDGEKGTGLGLSICREFIAMHNGNIWAESKEGKGTKVCFSIPF